MHEVAIYLLVGAAGALTKDILQDGKLQMPKIQDGSLYLGFLGGMALGSVTGWLTDNNPLMAFTSGFTGAGLAEALTAKLSLQVPKTTQNEPPTQAPQNESIEQIIRRVAAKWGVDQELAVRVAKCESALNPRAINVNTTGSRDRGIYQINDYYHPKVTDEQAFDPEFSADFFCNAVKAGKLSWWNASKHCWNK